MMKFEVIEAKPWHVGQMARTLKQEQREAISKFGVNLHKEMTRIYDASYYRKVWVIDGKIVAIGGVAGSIMSCVGFMWLAASTFALQYPVEMVKETKRQLANALSIHSELSATTIRGDQISKRFLHFFGFAECDSNEMWDTYELKKEVK